jgi:hypothetical protein
VILAEHIAATHLFSYLPPLNPLLPLPPLQLTVLCSAVQMSSMSSDPSKPVALTVSSAALLSLSQTAIGCALGVLLASKIEERKRSPAVVSIFIFAALTTAPLMIAVVADLVNGPRSRLGVRRRLRSIREDSGLQEEALDN